MPDRQLPNADLATYKKWYAQAADQADDLKGRVEAWERMTARLNDEVVALKLSVMGVEQANVHLWTNLYAKIEKLVKEDQLGNRYISYSDLVRETREINFNPLSK